MSLAEVNRIMNARSVAIFGASDDPAKWGGAMLRLLLRHGFDGDVYPINTRQEVVQGRKAWPDIESVPAKVDVAFVAVPGNMVESTIAACAQAGVGGCLIISSNFAETGEEGARRQDELVRIARSLGTRLIGPNCMGLMNTHKRFNLCNSQATDFYHHMPTGPVGIASQSGALMGSMLARAYDAGIGLSSAISVGNQADLELCDFFEYLIEDADTRVICLYMEGMKSPGRFVDLCRRSMAAGKPVLLTKAGRSKGGAYAVQSHTGSLAGGYESLAAMCDALGVQLMTDPLEMVEAAMAWVTVGAWQEGDVAVLTASGGGGALAIDAMEDAGLNLATLGPATGASLARYLPPTHLQLPFDVGVLAAHGATRDLVHGIGECAKAAMADPAVGAGIYVMTTQKYMDACTQVIIETARGCGKPFFLINLAYEVGGSATRAMREAGLVEFRHIGSAINVLATLRRMGRAMAAARPPAAAVAREVAAPLAAMLPDTGGQALALTEAATKALLAKAGLPVPKQVLASSAAAAARAAEEIGFPVVLKIEAEGVSHKSDMGGVELNLRNADEVRQAFGRIAAAADRHRVSDKMTGCLVQQSVPADVELIVGARWDEQFGTMLMVGMGGTLVELLKDVRLTPAPATRERVLDLLSELRLYPLLTGFRGSRPVDLEAVADTVVAIGRFAAALGPRLLEFDANPLRVSGDQVCIADARAVVI